MNKLFYVGLIAAIIFSAFPQVAHANLLSNSGFETWTGTPEVPTVWWNMFSDPDVTGSKEATIVKSGSYSGKTTFSGTGGGWGGWGQRVAFTAGNTLYAYQPINIPTALGGSNSLATLEIQFESAPDNGIDTSVKTSRSTATSGWEALSYSATAPTGTNYVKYVVMLETWGSGTGSAYFDDAYADNVPIPEPASLLLLGSGLIGMLAVTRRKR